METSKKSVLDVLNTNYAVLLRNSKNFNHNYANLFENLKIEIIANFFIANKILSKEQIEFILKDKNGFISSKTKDDKYSSEKLALRKFYQNNERKSNNPNLSQETREQHKELIQFYEDLNSQIVKIEKKK